MADDTCPDCGELYEECVCADGERDCQTCGGDGCVWGSELGDPFWYLSDELYDCPNCGGSGLAKDQTYW